MENPNKMPEAEVSLRLAFYLIEHGLVASDVRVAIDGAQVKTANTIHFGISEFFSALDWRKSEVNELWQGNYAHARHRPRVVVHSTPGVGDVVARLINGRTLRVECKKGPLVQSKASPEYPLMREAIGQLLTMERVDDADMLAIAVPSSIKFEELSRRWCAAPLMRRFGIHILTVGRDNQVRGLPDLKSVTAGQVQHHGD